MIQDLPKIAALTIEIGGAPVTVTSDNRGLVRKWLTANGASYTSIANLPLGELSKLYNNERALASFLADQREEPEEPQPVTDHIPKLQPAPAPIKSTPQVMTSAHDAAAQLLALLTPKAQELDEKEVRRIAADEAGKVAGIRPTTCEIKAPHREAVEVGICHRNFPLLVKMIGAGCNVWLAGPAGTGKTTAAEVIPIARPRFEARHQAGEITIPLGG